MLCPTFPPFFQQFTEFTVYFNRMPLLCIAISLFPLTNTKFWTLRLKTPNGWELPGVAGSGFSCGEGKNSCWILMDSMILVTAHNFFPTIDMFVANICKLPQLRPPMLQPVVSRRSPAARALLSVGASGTATCHGRPLYLFAQEQAHRPIDVRWWDVSCL